ncbi:MAG: hypothetical protein LBQ33_06125 [Oscillospiraceae bacterium]|jgi:hypothetical protein|nr:hypothetical protein [Oscillospiraceae bacterium]
MGYVYDLYINRECEDCVFGEFDLLAERYFCRRHEVLREPEDKSRCADFSPLRTAASK